MRSLAALAVAAAALATGCVRQYRPPAPGEPAAIVKVRLAYDRRAALGAIPGDGEARKLQVAVFVEEDGKRYLLTSRRSTDALEQAVPPPLETLATAVRPGRPVVVAIRLGVAWQTTDLETVTETERVPKEVETTEYVYDPSTNQTERKVVTHTEYEDRETTVTKSVTHDHEVGCTARVSLEPARDAVYLVDYTNPLVTDGCAASGFLQVREPDGTFSLHPLRPL
jgi:hypothetical protein